jgi:Tfp pilus assembly protein PilZ
MNILKLRIKSSDEWGELYQGDLPNGGLFVPTTTELEAGDTAVVELASPALPNKVMIRTVVRSWRPALPRLRVRAGAVVEFEGDEITKRDFVADVFSGRRDNDQIPRRRQSRLPVSIPVKYRLSSTAQFQDGAISEISVGGAMLNTAAPLPLDSDIVLEVIPPGGAAPLEISGKVSYHVPSGATGVKFLYRDGDGSRRLRELVRRLRAS